MVIFNSYVSLPEGKIYHPNSWLAGLEDDDWAPASAQEAFLVLPLTLGASLHREPRFLEVPRWLGGIQLVD